MRLSCPATKTATYSSDSQPQKQQFKISRSFLFAAKRMLNHITLNQTDVVQRIITIRVVHFLSSYPCTTIKHFSDLLSYASLCYGRETKQSRISLIYRIICFYLRRFAQQKKRSFRPLLSGKRKPNLQFLFAIYQYITAKFHCSWSRLRSAFFTPCCISIM